MNIRAEIEDSDLKDRFPVPLEQNEIPGEQAEIKIQQTKRRMSHFQMRYFFYIHLAMFFISGLFAGLAIYLVENYSKVKNQQMEVSYIDAWFISLTCACGCGLTTLNFSKLSTISQILLLILTCFCGITISTLPALAIKGYAHKHAGRINIDNDHREEVYDSEGHYQNLTPWVTHQHLPLQLEEKLARLPTPRQIRYWAYITIIALILVICTFVYLCCFIIVGAWLDVRYTENDLVEGNSTINPWYASIIIVITGFNQNGLTPFSDGMARFVNDAYINIFVMMVFFLARRFEVITGWKENSGNRLLVSSSG